MNGSTDNLFKMRELIESYKQTSSTRRSIAIIDEELASRDRLQKAAHRKNRRMYHTPK